MPRSPLLRRALPVFLASAFLGWSPAAASAGSPASEHERAGIREVIVEHVRGLKHAGRARLRDSVDAVAVRRLSLPDTDLLRVPAGRLDEALAELADSPDVVYAEANARVRAYGEDAYWQYQWALANAGQDIFGTPGTPDADIDAPEAWPASIGTGITVGIVDTGIHASHPELAGRLTGNPGEVGDGRESNLVDDDGNGYVDDHSGWDFVPDDNDGNDSTAGPDSTPEDPDGHGTHVAGIVAAERGNQQGIAGAAPGARIVALRALGVDGSGELADVAEAFRYAGELGLPVVNASLGSNSESLAIRSAIADHPGTLFVAAAGNGGADGIGDDVDRVPEYPCATAEDNVLCVGASDSDDRRASFSNFGFHTVDLFAPGVDIVSTYSAPSASHDVCAGDYYCALSGSSMAAPHAAAVAALVASIRPDPRGAELRRMLIASAEVKPSLGASGRRRLNAARALEAVADGDSDGVENLSDNCRAMPNGDQADADGDGAGDACDATPHPSPPAPAPSATPVPGPSPTPVPSPPASRPSLDSRPLRLAARLSHRTLARRGSVVAAIRTSEPASVALRLTRSGSMRVLAQARGSSRTGVLRLVIARRVAGRRLAPGRHEVTIVARADGRTAATRLALLVR